MKILKANGRVLTNFEVLDFLRSRGAVKDRQAIASIAPSELKVYDYLENSSACSQTRESITEFLGKCKKYGLKIAETISIINVRPSSVVEIDPMIEACDARIGESVEELVEMVVEVLPSPPTQMESDEGIGDCEDKNPDEKQPEAS